MDGPSHYKEAEQHIKYACDCRVGTDGERFNLALAQVHATLAVAAAAALHHVTDMTAFGDVSPAEAWREVVS